MTGAEATVGIALLLGALLIVFPATEDSEPAGLPELAKPSASFQERLNDQLAMVATQTRSGASGELLEKHNPFVRFPELNKFEKIQQTVRTISNPAAIEQLIPHPRIDELKNKPAVQAAIDKLKFDEAIRQIIGSEEPLNQTRMSWTNPGFGKRQR